MVIFEKEMKSLKNIPKWIAKKQAENTWNSIMCIYTFILCEFVDVAGRENIDLKSIVLHLGLFKNHN